MKNILVGMCYVGSLLTLELNKNKFKVRVIDNQWFGKNLKKHKNLKIIKKDIRKLK